VPCLGERETRLAPPHPQLPGERLCGGVLAVDLGAQRAQFVFVGRRVRAVEQLETDPWRGHESH
jgi:hypothetical protein